ncbi:MAG: NTP transferase domain-containing protein [Myxococcota bacterium]|nr:NTP transferase domain-containing protein [Myxococcota bacterium]
MHATAVILAAGESTKLPVPKAMLEYEKGKSFLRSIASSFRKAGCDVVAVVGYRGDEVRTQNPDVRLLENSDWKSGQLGSARVGIQAALDDGAEAIILHPVDMPTFRASTVKSLLEKLDGAEAVLPEFEGVTGRPVVLSRAAAEKVLRMDSSGTLESALPRLAVKKMATRDPGVMVNINSAEVYQRIFGQEPKAAPPPKKRGKAAAEE